MKTQKLTWYQKYFNKKLGYRDDYQNKFWYYIKQMQKNYFIYYFHYDDKKANSGKKMYETVSITLFWYTPLAIKFQFNWHNYLFFGCELTFSIIKLDFQFILFGFKMNTA